MNEQETRVVELYDRSNDNGEGEGIFSPPSKVQINKPRGVSLEAQYRLTLFASLAVTVLGGWLTRDAKPVQGVLLLIVAVLLFIAAQLLRVIYELRRLE